MDYPSSNYAMNVNKSLEADNYKFLKTELLIDKLTVVMESKSFMSLLHTIEDYLSCLITAENILDQEEIQEEIIKK
jgi:hypothetical protein